MFGQETEREIALREYDERNREYLGIFEKYLRATGLTEATIDRHIDNVEFYLAYYLCKDEIKPLRSGCYDIGDFLGDWFIRKVLWASPITIKSLAASIKKFYKCMMEKKLVSPKDYDALIALIKSDKVKWLKAYDDYQKSERAGTEIEIEF